MSNIITFGPQSNRADLSETWEAIDDNGDAIDLTDATIVFALVDPATGSSVIAASTDDGKITIATTQFTLAIAKSEFASLSAKSYNVGCTITQDDFTEQFFVGTMPIYEGWVP